MKYLVAMLLVMGSLGAPESPRSQTDRSLNSDEKIICEARSQCWQIPKRDKIEYAGWRVTG
jgi:hypothetical protein